MPQAIPHDETVIELASETLHADALATCRRLLTAWKDIPSEDVKVTVVSGGITNVLLLADSPANRARVLVRVFGDNTDMLIDRERELLILHQLNAAGFGASVLGTFPNGRIEAFLYGHTLKPEDVRCPIVGPQIAHRLAEFHAVLVDEDDRSPKLWTNMDLWLGMAKALTWDDPKQAAQFAAVDFGSIEREIAATRAMCDATHSPVVYSHNDLLPGNIMALHDDASPLVTQHMALQFIDFEYGCYGFRGFDWGNHFNEWAGLDCDYSQCPTLTQQEAFLREYLQTSTVRSVSPEQVAMAIAEANAFSLASHLFWAVWALLQAKYSTIDFDYIEYSAQRLAEYHSRKPHVKQLVLKEFPAPCGEPPKLPFAPAFPEADAADIPHIPPVSTAPVIGGTLVPPPVRM